MPRLRRAHARQSTIPHIGRDKGGTHNSTSRANSGSAVSSVFGDWTGADHDRDSPGFMIFTATGVPYSTSERPERELMMTQTRAFQWAAYTVANPSAPSFAPSSTSLCCATNAHHPPAPAAELLGGGEGGCAGSDGCEGAPDSKRDGGGDDGSRKARSAPHRAPGIGDDTDRGSGDGGGVCEPRSASCWGVRKARSASHRLIRAPVPASLDSRARAGVTRLSGFFEHGDLRNLSATPTFPREGEPREGCAEDDRPDGRDGHNNRPGQERYGMRGRRRRRWRWRQRRQLR